MSLSSYEFKESMYENVINENFELEYFTFKIQNKSQFSEIIESEKRFREFICQKVCEIHKKKKLEKRCEDIKKMILKAYLEKFESEFLAAYAFAFWFMKFDEDNWFEFMQVCEVCESYFTSPSGENLKELRLFKGFVNEGYTVPPLSVLDLPVVVDKSEKSITIWICRLND